jgi:hypothetical protein
MSIRRRLSIMRRNSAAPMCRMPPPRSQSLEFVFRYSSSKLCVANHVGLTMMTTMPTTPIAGRRGPVSLNSDRISTRSISRHLRVVSTNAATSSPPSSLVSSPLTSRSMASPLRPVSPRAYVFVVRSSSFGILFVVGHLSSSIVRFFCFCFFFFFLVLLFFFFFFFFFVLLLLLRSFSMLIISGDFGDAHGKNK